MRFLSASNFITNTRSCYNITHSARKAITIITIRRSLFTSRDEYRKALPAEWAHFPLKLRWSGPIVFFLGTSMTIFGIAAHATNLETDSYLKALDSHEIEGISSQEDYTDVNNKLRVLKCAYTIQCWSLAVREARDWLHDSVALIKESKDGEEMGEWTINCAAALRHPLIFCRAYARPDIIALTALIPLTLAWYIPGLHTSLFRHWTHSLRSGKSYTMLTALFCHQQSQWVNILATCICVPIAAEWFINPPDPVLPESTPWYHFVAFLLTAGMFTFHAPQYLTYLRFRSAFQRLARGRDPGVYTNVGINKALSYSLGVSGVVHACITLVVPWHSDKITSATTNERCPSPIPVTTISPKGYLWLAVCTAEVLCMFKSVGNIQWARNLCGVGFGVFYRMYGEEWWKSVRKGIRRVNGQLLIS